MGALQGFVRRGSLLGAAALAVIAAGVTGWLMTSDDDVLNEGARRALDGASRHGGVLAGSAAGLLTAAAVVGAARRRSSNGNSIATSARRLLRRKHLDAVLDTLRFRIDTFPRSLGLLKFLGVPELDSALVYQDLPWVGLKSGRRGDSTHTRWEAMRRFIDDLDVQSAVDIGANIGWFVFAFDALGIPAVGVEREARSVRIALYARQRTPQPSRASFLVLDLDPTTLRFVPPADCVVCLSVWHHFVRDVGLEPATRMLRGIWERTNKVLFFETGENEMPLSWGLPRMEPDSATWLTSYLEETCTGSRIVHLGRHDAGLDGATTAMRNLFAIVRA